MANLPGRVRWSELLDRRMSGVRNRSWRASSRGDLSFDPTELSGFIEHLARTVETGTRHRLAAKFNQSFQSATPGERRTLCAALEGVETDDELAEVLFRLSAVEGGMRTCADMNEFVSANPEWPRVLRAVRARLRQLSTADLLELRRIDWSAPASFLEQLSDYDRVHAVAGADDLKNRLADDRRCYVLFHPALDDRPIALVWVALTKTVPERISELLDIERVRIDPTAASVAVFYSISNTHPGMAGLRMGNELLVDVLGVLDQELGGVHTFVTLSPVPHFMEWLRTSAEAQDPDGVAALKRPLPESLRLLTDPVWMASREARSIAPALSRLVARYLTSAGLPPCPVARFHFSNGAQLADVRFAADLSPTALEQSGGVMVNYAYDVARLENRAETWATSAQPSVSARVNALINADD